VDTTIILPEPLEEGKKFLNVAVRSDLERSAEDIADGFGQIILCISPQDHSHVDDRWETDVHMLVQDAVKVRDFLDFHIARIIQAKAP
jgi:hypothetical protein